MTVLDAQHYFLLQTWDVGFYGFVGFWVDGHFELSATVQGRIADYLYYQERQGHHLVLLFIHFLLHFSIVGAELLLAYLILFLTDILDETAQFAVIMNGDIDIDGKEAQESYHQLLL